MNEALRRPAIALLAFTLALTGVFILVLERPSEGQARIPIACSTGLVGQATDVPDHGSFVTLYAVNTSTVPIEVRLKFFNHLGDQIVNVPRTIPPQDTGIVTLVENGLVRLRGVVQIVEGAEDFSHVLVTMDYVTRDHDTGTPLTDTTLEHCQLVSGGPRS